MKLSCKEKCLVKLVRDKADLCGVWSPNWIIACAYLGETVTEEELLKIDGGDQFVKIDGGNIFCIGFIEFQYGELSERSPVHRKILSLLESHGLKEKYKKIGYKYPINRVQEEEEDKEEEKDKEKEEENAENFVFNTMPKPEDCGELPEIIAGSAIELMRITKNVTITMNQVYGLWPVFLQQNATGKKYYQNIEDVRSHFLNWIKKQEIGKSAPSNGEKKLDAMRDYINR